MSKNVFSDQVFKNLLNQTVNLLNQHNYNTETAFFLCPFQIVLGATLTTETGRKGLNARPKDYAQVQLAINSKDTISVYWRNSYEIINSELSIINKKYKVGDNFLGFVTNESLNFTTTSDYQRLLRIQTTKTFNCFVPKLLTGVNDEFFKLIEDEWFYFWQIPQFENRKENFNVLSTITYFKIESWVYLRDNNNVILGAQVNFISVNNEFQQNGLSLETYVQAGFPGEPKCFPILKKKEHNTYEVIINDYWLKYIPANAFQHTIIDLAGWMGAIVMGFPITELHLSVLKEQQEEMLYLPGALWIYDILTPAEDKLLIKQLPETDYYVSTGELDINVNLNILKDLKNWMEQRFNPNQIQGFLKTDPATTKLSNPENKFLTYWNNDFLGENEIDYTPLFKRKAKFKLTASFWNSLPVFDVRGNDWFQASYEGKIYGIKRFSFADIKNKNLAHFLMFNAICLKTLINLPATTKNNIPVTTRVIGMFSSILHILSFGLVPEWKDKNIVNLPKNSKVNFLIPAEIYNNYEQLWTRTAIGENFTRFGSKLFGFANEILNFGSQEPKLPQNIQAGSIPLEVFLGGENQLTTTFGTSGTIQTFGGLITNKINTVCYEINTNNTIYLNVTTTDIGQKIKYNDKFYIPLYSENTTLLSPDTKLSDYDKKIPSEIIGYMINVNSYKLIGGSAVQFKVYNLQTGSQQVLDDEKSIYIDTYRTFSNYLRNPRLINNIHRLGNPLFDFNKIFEYPKDLFPVPPSPESKEYVKRYNNINLTIYKNEFVDTIGWYKEPNVLVYNYEFNPNSGSFPSYVDWLDVKLLINDQDKFVFDLKNKHPNDEIIEVTARKLSFAVAFTFRSNVDFLLESSVYFKSEWKNSNTNWKEAPVVKFEIINPKFLLTNTELKVRKSVNFKNISFSAMNFYNDQLRKAYEEIHFDRAAHGEVEFIVHLAYDLSKKTFRISKINFYYSQVNLRYNFKGAVNKNPIIVPEVWVPSGIQVKNKVSSFEFKVTDVTNFKIEGLTMKFRQPKNSL